MICKFNAVETLPAYACWLVLQVW